MSSTETVAPMQDDVGKEALAETSDKPVEGSEPASKDVESVATSTAELNPKETESSNVGAAQPIPQEQPIDSTNAEKPEEESKPVLNEKKAPEATQPQPPDSSADKKETEIGSLMLAGRIFTTREELIQHVKKIQESVVDDEGRLSTESALFMFHLFLHHPTAIKKMSNPISHFRYGNYEAFKNKCFIMCRADGTQEGMSAAKSINEVWPKGGAPVNSSAAALASISSSSTAASQEIRGVKRNQEVAEIEPPKAFEPVPTVIGSVIDIHGVPGSVGYKALKEQLQEFGHVKFLQYLRPAKKARTEKNDSAGEKLAENITDKTQDSVEGSDKSKELAASSSGAVGSSEDKTAVDAETAPMDEDEEESEEPEKDVPSTARCRFADADGAKKALENLRELDEVKVEVVLLTGTDEENFWAETNAKLKDLFDNPRSKGKGKDKGKGKGKGKGKKKGKDKKGD